ncbi:MAG: hypothetical protein WD423_03910, partial [Rhodothermales bacterium]
MSVNVLIVGDERSSRDTIAGLAKCRGHEVTVCDTTDAAWTAVGRTPSVLAVVDWSVPGAERLCRRMRSCSGERA